MQKQPDERRGDQPGGMLELAFSRGALRRTVPAAVIVGTTLTAVNSGAAIVDGRIDGDLLARVALTYAVPFLNASVGFVLGSRTSTAPTSTSGMPQPP